MEYGVTKGPAGDLEWMFSEENGTEGLILCHPHPLYGGSMMDGVLDIASEVAKSLNISVVRFNFRGVGASEGSHDHGTGEVEDLKTIVTEFEPKFERLTLGGYSFGAGVTLSYAQQLPTPGRLVLFAPPTGASLPDIDAEIHILVGDSDSISSVDSLNDWALSNPQRFIHVIDDADHFIAGYRADLKEILQDVLAT